MIASNHDLWKITMRISPKFSKVTRIVLFIALIVAIMYIGYIFLKPAHPPKKYAPENAVNTTVGATEDLMREHGILNRLLLIYEAIIEKASKAVIYEFKLLDEAATLLHTFIENYHEKLEEEYVFPRMESAGTLVSLVQELKLQHQKGREITQNIRDLTQKLMNGEAMSTSSKITLLELLKEFITMYRAHTSREDTELFPAFHSMIPEKEFDKLGDFFEQKEHELVGENGFEHALAQVESIEKALGINNLAHYTP